jgi:chemotaxis protein MotB
MAFSDKGKKPLFLPKTESEDEWMLTYADMITLLFAFMVVIVSISDVDKEKLQRVAESMAESVGGTRIESRISLEELESSLGRIIKEENMQSQAEVSRSPHGVTIRFKGNVLFASASSDLSPKASSILGKLAGEIKSRPYHIDVEGHTDDRPITTVQYPSNWELSGARAASVIRFFIEHGVPADGLRAIGRADTEPLRPNRDETNQPIPENQAYNRRVEVTFLTNF